MDVQTIGMIAGAVALGIIILYVLDRWSKQEDIDVANAAKLGVSAAAVAGGVAYAVSGDEVAEVAEKVTTAAQEMFVGKPEF
jgi:uncharacterized protein (DUF2252 family)